MTKPSERLAQLRLSLPEVAAPVAAYRPAVRTGNLVYSSGQLPTMEGRLITTGTVGSDVSLEQATHCARTAALNGLAAVAAEAGGIDEIARVVKVVVFVASSGDFTDQPQVANGASQLLGELFGESGRHARSAVGVVALPLGAPVEVEMVVEVGARPTIRPL